MGAIRVAYRRRDSAFVGLLVRQAFAHADRLLPLHRVGESAHVVGFRHPVPGFAPVHILLVPKLSVRSVMHLTPEQRDQIAAEVQRLALDVVDSLGTAHTGFLVLVNGGSRQDVRQLHFHLLTGGYHLAPAPAALKPGVWTDVADPTQLIHQARAGADPLLAGLTHATEVDDALKLGRRGYSVIWDARARERDDIVHLTS
jgi:histidine triad (HIT) family protein